MRKILIVEDNALNRDLLTQLLEDDYRLIQATNGPEGIRLAVEQIPDLILMDMGLPGMDGWEATRAVKAEAACRHIPVVAVTAHARQEDHERALRAGCDGVITKPIDEERLFECLHGLLE